MSTALPVLLLMFVLVGAAAPDEEQAAAPSFRAGAEVTLGLTVKAPPLWVINPGVPFRVTFDKAALKDAGVSSGKLVQDFKLENYGPLVYIELPVKLNKDVAEGELTIPLSIDCGICTADQESCTTASGQFEARVAVLNTALPDNKESALKRGTAPSSIVLLAPW